MRFDQVSLATLQRTNRQIEGRCFECDAVLHVDLPTVIAAHGKAATLAKVGYTILCPVCEAAGLFLRERRTLSRPRESHPASYYGGDMLDKTQTGQPRGGETDRYRNSPLRISAAAARFAFRNSPTDEVTHLMVEFQPLQSPKAVRPIETAGLIRTGWTSAQGSKWRSL